MVVGCVEGTTPVAYQHSGATQCNEHDHHPLRILLPSKVGAVQCVCYCFTYSLHPVRHVSQPHTSGRHIPPPTMTSPNEDYMWFNQTHPYSSNSQPEPEPRPPTPIVTLPSPYAPPQYKEEWMAGSRGTVHVPPCTAQDTPHLPHNPNSPICAAWPSSHRIMGYA